MNDQEEWGAFCFSCAAQAPHFEPTDPNLLRNPWPLLVRSNELNYPRTQPLIRTFYSPRPMADVNTIRAKRQDVQRQRPTRQALDDFYQWFIWLHEYGHLLVLDWTPAKEAAKLVLASCYNSLECLLFQPSVPAETAWNSFQASKKQLNQLEEGVGFIEELMSTTLALKAIEAQTLPQGMWVGFQEEMESLKGEALANEEKHFTGFRAAAEQVQPLLQLMFGNPRFFSFIIPLLQPIKTDSESMPFKVVDGQKQLKRILKIVEGIDDAEAAISRLKHLYQKEKIIYGWATALSLLLESSQTAQQKSTGTEDIYGQLCQMLWSISRGELQEQAERDVEEEDFQLALQTMREFSGIIAQGKPLGLGCHLILQRATYRGQRYINLHSEQGLLPEDVLDNFCTLLFFEGIREQLIARKGLICPYNVGKRHCQCNQWLQKALARLYHLADDGLFGSGEWSLPPCLPRRRL